jgi:hypothetical protein
MLGASPEVLMPKPRLAMAPEGRLCMTEARFTWHGLALAKLSVVEHLGARGV